MLPEESPKPSSTIEATEQSTASDTASLPEENSEEVTFEKKAPSQTKITTDKAEPKSLYEIREQLRQQNN